VRPEYGTNDAIASYLTGNLMMLQYYTQASKYNVQSVQGFELYDSQEGNYGMLQSDGKTKKAAYTAVKNFIANHPR